MSARVAPLVLAFGSVAWFGFASDPTPQPPAKDAHGDPLPPGAKFRLGTTRFTAPDYALHTATHLALSPDGRSYAVTGADVVSVYSVSTGTRAWTATSISDEDGIRDHTGQTIAYRADGAAIATTGRGGVAIWDAKTGKRLSAVKFPTDSPQQFVLSGDFKLAAGTRPGDETGSVTLWNPTDGTALGEIAPVHNEVHRLALSANNRVLAVAGQYRPKDESEAEANKAKELTGLVQLWELPSAKPEGFAATKKELGRIKLQLPSPEFTSDGQVIEQPAPELRLSPDGATLYALTKAGADSWDTASGKRLYRFAGRSQARDALWLSADGKRLAASSPDGFIDVWYTETGERVASGTQPPAERWSIAHITCGGSVILGFGKSPVVVALPDGSAPVVAAIDVNRVRTGSLGKGAVTQPSGHRSGVRAVTYSGDGKQIVTLGGAQVIRWDSATGKQIGPAKSLGSDGLLAGDGVWRGAVLSPGGRFLVAPTADRIKLIDLTTGAEHLTIPLPDETATAYSLSFSADGSRLCASVEIQDEAAPRELVSVWNTETGQVVFEKSAEAKAGEEVSTAGVCLSPDGSKLFWARNRKQPEKRVTEWTGWELATGKLLGRAELSDGFAESPVPLPDNRSVLTYGPNGRAVWDVSTGKFRDIDCRVYGVPIVSPDGSKFAIHEIAGADENGKPTPAQVVIYDLKTGKPTKQIVGAEVNEAPCLAFSPDGKYLVTGHADSTALVWEVAALPAAK